MAHEGDARDLPGFKEGVRVSAAGYVLDPALFPNADTLKPAANLGSLQVINGTATHEINQCQLAIAAPHRRARCE
ncbi:MAG: choice-of-anchor I domain-containing protein [Candidatus Binatia bacterium]